MDRLLRPLAAVAAAAVLLSACSLGVPRSGEVVTVSTVPSQRQSEVVDGPLVPEPGTPPVAVAVGFMRAMSTIDPARAGAWAVAEPGTRQALAAWEAGRTVRLYDEFTVRESAQDTTRTVVTVVVNQQGSLLDGVTWQPGTGDEEFDLELRREGGQWRVTNPPDIPRMRVSDFQQRFERTEAYLVDPDGEELVPVPVFFRVRAGVAESSGTPGTDGRPTAADLVRSALDTMLTGPQALGEPTLRTAVPDGTSVRGVRLANGVAEVDLSEEFGRDGGLSGRLRVAQVVRTVTGLAQTPEVRLRVAGRPAGAVGPERFEAAGSWRANDPAFAKLVATRGGSTTNVLFVRNGQLHRVPYGEGEPGVRVIPVPAAGNVSAPTWSPDGRSVAFLVQDGDEARLWVGSPDGRQAEPSELTGRLSQPSFMRDGRRLLVLRQDDEGTSLWSVPAAGGAVTRLEMPPLPDGLHAGSVVVDPTGSFVLTLGITPGGRMDAGGRLFAGRLDGDRVTRWTASSIAPGLGEVFSPLWLDAFTIAFVARSTSQADPGSLWIVDRDGWRPERVQVGVAPGLALGDRPTVSPSGGEFVFTVRSNNGISQLFALRRSDGRGAVPLTAPDQDASDVDPSFSSR